MLDERPVRAFVAVELPDNIKTALGQVEEELKNRLVDSLGPTMASRSLKWVNPTGIHLTLKFLGAVPAKRLLEVEAALHRAVTNAAVGALGIRATSLSAFPNINRPRVLWIGIEGDLERLARLQEQIDVELSGLGFPRETRAFNPHLTLARMREAATAEEAKKIGEVLKSAPVAVNKGAQIEAISLMRSVLTRAGAEYSRLAEIQLGTTESKR